MSETKEPTQEALIAQLREMNERSRSYGRQFWHVPFAYLGGAGIILLQAADQKHGPIALTLALPTIGVTGLFVVWHLKSLRSAAYRSYCGIKDIEKQLLLSPARTRWTPGHLDAFLLLTVAASLASLAAALYTDWRHLMIYPPAVVVLLNLGGGLALAFAFAASRETEGLVPWYRWGPGTAISFNRGLFWVGVAGLVIGNVLGAIR